jgi:hypothetical protein
VRDYSKVSPRFWTGETGRELRKLGKQTQVVAFYLFTCPSANMLGLYYLAMPTLCHETGSPLQGAMKALRSLKEVNFAYYDLPSEQVYVPNMAREQIGERLERRDNRHKAVLNELQRLRKTPFFNDFLSRYRVPFELQDVEIEPTLASPLGGPSEPLRSQNQNQEQKQEQNLRVRDKRAFNPDEVAGLDRDAWNRWVEYRAERKPAIKAVSMREAAEELAAFGHDQALVVKKAIAAGYQGLFNPKSVHQNGSAKSASHSAEWAELEAKATAIGFRGRLPTDTIETYRTDVMLADRPKHAAPRAIAELASKLRVGH